MTLTDVNVLIYAHREETHRHSEYRIWLENEMNLPTGFATSEFILSSFLRIATHPRIMDPPTPLEQALQFTNTLRSHPSCVLLQPGNRHWDIFMDLCLKTDSRGNLVADAYLAALAIEHGCQWITTDRDFARFPGLNWRHPLKSR